MADLVAKIEFGGTQVIITKFGKPKVMVVPYREATSSERLGLKAAFGAWKQRKDVTDLRKKSGRNYGKTIFS